MENVMSKEGDNQTSTENPQFCESPFPTVVVWGVTTILTSSVAIWVSLKIWPQFREDWGRILFIIYLSVYFSMWLVYFLSKSKRKFLKYFRVGTLRRLLFVKSKHWTAEDSKIGEAFMEKAKTSITAIAMLVAVAFLGMMQTKDLYFDLIALTKGERYQQTTWYLMILGFAASCSLIAFICFVISADALDGMFNEFEDKKLDNRIRRYLYKTTIHPRYFGLVFLISSIIFLMAYIHSILGSIVIGLIITIGYRHWFPKAELIEDDLNEMPVHCGFTLRLFFFLTPPILVSLII